MTSSYDTLLRYCRTGVLCHITVHVKDHVCAGVFNKGDPAGAPSDALIS